MHINRLLIDIQESSPKAFKIAKTPELPGVLPPGPTRDGSCDLCLSNSINFFMTGTLFNFKILAKALLPYIIKYIKFNSIETHRHSHYKTTNYT